LCCPRLPQQHVGSLDVDLALNHQTLQDPGYRTIHQLLVNRGYREGKQPFTFHRPVRIGDREFVVQVDFLAGEYEGTGKSHRTQEVQDIRARKARGCDLAFEMWTELMVEGALPEGGRDSARVRVASMVPFLVMKGIALGDRLKEKDAWDIAFCVRNYPGGTRTLAQEFLPHIEHGLVREGLQIMAQKFSSPAHIGPRFVADFEDIVDREERDLRQRDAYERLQELLRKLGMAT